MSWVGEIKTTIDDFCLHSRYFCVLFRFFVHLKSGVKVLCHTCHIIRLGMHKLFLERLLSIPFIKGSR